MKTHSAKSLSMAEIREKIKQTVNPIEDQTLIDLVCNYLKKRKEDYTEFDAKRWICIMDDSQYDSNIEDNSSEHIEFDLIKKYKSIRNIGLLFHLSRKGIPLSIAKKYLIQLKVFDPMEQKKYPVLGFPHEKDGFIISSPLYDYWVGKRAISFVQGQDSKTKIVYIFPTFWDYLSILAYWNCQHLQVNVIILNSYDCIEQVKKFIYKNGYKKVYTWLSNDIAGFEASKQLFPILNREESLLHIKANELYKPFSTVEQWYQQQIQKK